MKNYVIFLLAILSVSCASSPPPNAEPGSPPAVEQPEIPAPSVPLPGEAPPDSALYAKCASGTWCYDALIGGRVTNKLVATDPGIYCPKYKTLPRKYEFWQAFAKAVTRAECGWKPGSWMQEKFNDSKGKPVISAGMFQLSTGDAPRYSEYPDCKKIADAKYLFDPITNLKCGMGVMDKLSGSRPTFRESAGRYWSTIRDNKNGHDGITLAETVKKYYPSCF